MENDRSRKKFKRRKGGSQRANHHNYPQQSPDARKPPPGLQERRKWRGMLLQSNGKVIAGPGKFQNRGKSRFNGGKHGLMLALTEPLGAPADTQ